MPPRRTRIYDLLDRLMEGQLADELRRLRAEGESYERIARWLSTQHDVELTAEAVRQWVLALDDEPEAASA